MGIEYDPISNAGGSSWSVILFIIIIEFIYLAKYAWSHRNKMLTPR